MSDEELTMATKQVAIKKNVRRRRKKKLPPSPVNLLITKISHEGRGISDVEGKVTFVDNALPGETVVCELLESRRGILGGKAVEVLDSSPDRQTPACEFFNVCGGCSLQHMSSKAQLEFKQATLSEHFFHFGGVPVSRLEPPLTGPTEAYRHKARLAVRHVPKKGGVLVGFREKYSHYVADITTCTVLHPRVGTLLPQLRSLINGLTVLDKIPQIEVAVGESANDVPEVAMIFRHLAPLTDEDHSKLMEFGQEHEVQVYLQSKGPDTVHRIWPVNGVQRLAYSLPDFDLSLQFHPLDFTQVNPMINRDMVSQAVDWLRPQPHEKILDLFCGLGNFTLALARRAGEVVGVEGSAEMVKRGYENAALNNLSNCNFFSTDLTDASLQNELESGQLNPNATRVYPWLQSGYTKALIDPPRSGAQEILPCLAYLGIKSLVYVSCNPVTLARDTGILKEMGYGLERIGILDMFPHTSHVETMAYFKKLDET